MTGLVQCEAGGPACTRDTPDLFGSLFDLIRHVTEGGGACHGAEIRRCRPGEVYVKLHVIRIISNLVS